MRAREGEVAHGAGFNRKCRNPGGLCVHPDAADALDEPGPNGDQRVVDMGTAVQLSHSSWRPFQHVTPARVIGLGGHLVNQVVAVFLHQFLQQEVQAGACRHPSDRCL